MGECYKKTRRRPTSYPSCIEVEKWIWLCEEVGVSGKQGAAGSGQGGGLSHHGLPPFAHTFPHSRR